jgi:hypothetical protein
MSEPKITDKQIAKLEAFVKQSEQKPQPKNEVKK